MLSNRDGNVVSLGAEGVVVLPNKSLSKMEEEGFFSNFEMMLTSPK